MKLNIFPPFSRDNMICFCTYLIISKLQMLYVKKKFLKRFLFSWNKKMHTNVFIISEA